MFEDLKSQWENQPQPNTPEQGSKLIVDKMKGLSKKQAITNWVLWTTILILIGFFFYVEAFNDTIVTFALLLMMSSLLVRIFVEYFSIKKLRAIDVTENSSVFRTTIISYYKSRIRTHYVTTPIIIILYSFGFILLLPTFKRELSEGFYTYIVCSAVIVLIVMVIFIRNQIKNELSILKGLQI
ncbi:hypothetical protein [Psychroserpens sp. SPM9]|uniref:hypothetical protein n=1 Tax=Psychroserpens sp. SPM9 TaxID=2975598 RepID=UPI0021A3E674|nr:hypothetical protein [Psychroserpens sp. SPM9]MDG5491141.1 hypothetical protein [Psychroserpens sp. SPM9]